MTVNQFHKEFKIFLDKVDSSSYSELKDGEIDIYLNEAQERFVKQRYGANNLYGTGFEQSQKRTEDLKELVVSRYFLSAVSSTYSGTGLNVYQTDLSTGFSDSGSTVPNTAEYMFFTKAITLLKKGTCETWCRTKLVQHDDITNVMLDPFNRPNTKKSVSFFEEGGLYVWAPVGYSVVKALVTYIKRPVSINKGTYGFPVVQCELSEHTHKEILQIAIGLALEGLENPRAVGYENVILPKTE
jgi:hypothetical protein